MSRKKKRDDAREKSTQRKENPAAAERQLHWWDQER